MPPERDILFISPVDQPFVRDDLEFLRRRYSVSAVVGGGLKNAVRIFLKIFAADAVFCWFASVYAFIGVFVGNFLNVKSIVVVGGVDVADDARLNYGIWLSPWRARLLRYVFHHAQRILVVDPSLIPEATRLAAYDGSNISYVPTGYDAEFWKPYGAKEQCVLTVASVRERNRALVKGLDLLIEAAWKMPAVNFTVIGVEPRLGLSLRPPMNMKFYAPMPRNDLLPFYQRSKVYCQPSRREGLANSLCEAMLCACIPVASSVGGNPTALGTEGILVPPDDSEALVYALHRALTTEDPMGETARARIVSLFPRQKRENSLTHAIESVLT